MEALLRGMHVSYSDDILQVAVVDFFTIVPSFLNLAIDHDGQWMSLKFLRINRALMAYVNLEK